MKILYVTDIHGDVKIVDSLVSEALERKVSAVMIGGDLAPGFDVFRQRFFIESVLVPGMEKLSVKGVKAFVQMGNDDFGANMDVLRKAEEQGYLKTTSMRTLRLGKYYVTGYSFVNPTPFLFKEWEKEEDEIRKDLEGLGKNSDPEKTIFVFHAPPYNTNLDLLHNREHAGSRAIREFIEREHPLLTLHGHIHESPEMSGDFRDRIGKTLCINPGKGKIALIDMERMRAELIS